MEESKKEESPKQTSSTEAKSASKPKGRNNTLIILLIGLLAFCCLCSLTILGIIALSDRNNKDNNEFTIDSMDEMMDEMMDGIEQPSDSTDKSGNTSLYGDTIHTTMKFLGDDSSNTYAKNSFEFSDPFNFYFEYNAEFGAAHAFKYDGCTNSDGSQTVQITFDKVDGVIVLNDCTQDPDNLETVEKYTVSTKSKQQVSVIIGTQTDQPNKYYYYVDGRSDSAEIRILGEFVKKANYTNDMLYLDDMIQSMDLAE